MRSGWEMEERETEEGLGVRQVGGGGCGVGGVREGASS